MTKQEQDSDIKNESKYTSKITEFNKFHSSNSKSNSKNQNQDYVLSEEYINLDQENIESCNVELESFKDTSIKNSSIQASQGVSIQAGGGVHISGSCFISGGNIVISSNDIYLDGATISATDNLSFEAENDINLKNQVNLAGKEIDFHAEALVVEDESNLNIEAEEFNKNTKKEVLGNNSSISFNKK